MFLPNNRPFVPKNEKAIRPATETIKSLATLQQRYNQNAILPDGRLSLLYIPKINGLPCTCCSVFDPLDDSGNLTSESIEDILENAKKDYSLAPYASEGFTIDYDFMPVVADGEEAEESVDYKLTGVPSTSCNVCFGTQFIGGYNLYGGARIVLDARAFVRTGMLLDSSPIQVDCKLGDTLTTKIVVPKGATRVDFVGAYSNSDLLDVEVRLDGVEVGASNLLTFCTGLEQTIEILFTKPAKFTHFVLQYGYIDLYIDYSKYVNTTQNDRFAQLGDFTLAVPPLTGTSNLKGSIVVDGVEGLTYRISEMSRSSNRFGNPLITECNARAVQPYETTYGLPRLGKTLQNGGKQKTDYPRRSKL